MRGEGSVAEVLAGEARYAVVCGERDEVLAAMADAAVDVTITDAPYDDRTHAGVVTATTHARGRRGDDVRAVSLGFDPLANVAWWGDALRVTRRWCLTFCAVEMVGDYRRVAPDAWVRAGLWVRTNAMAQMSGDRPGQGAEGVAIAHPKGRKRWNGGGHPAVWMDDLPRGVHASAEEPRLHPTQKPLRLMRELVRLFSDPGEVIADWHAGSGTTGVAALLEGRRVILVERNPEHAATCRRRLAETVPGEGSRKAKQLGLFAGGAK